MSAPQPPSSKDGPRVNHDITAFEVLVIDDEGTQRGIMKKIDAIRLAEEEGYDLVEVAPMAKPPVCRLMDFGLARRNARRLCSVYERFIYRGLLFH